MKLCYFNDYRLGVVKGAEVVDVTDAVKDIPHLHAAELIFTSRRADAQTAFRMEIGRAHV